MSTHQQYFWAAIAALFTTLVFCFWLMACTPRNFNRIAACMAIAAVAAAANALAYAGTI